MSVHFGKLFAVGELSACEVCSRIGEPNLVVCLVRALRVWRIGTSLGLGALALTAGCTPTVADTVDLGDNPEPPDVTLDESFFHCEIQPLVITAQGCVAGGAGEGGSCHGARSALRLVEVPTASLCQNGRLVGSAAAESIVNFERIRTSVGPDADASPLYRRPLGLDSHPRMIFAPDSQAAMLLRSWLNGQNTP